MPWRRQIVATAAEVRQADRLAAAAVVGDRDHAERDALGADVARSAPRASRDVDVALERVATARLASPRRSRDRRPRRPECSMLARVVSKWLLLGMTLPGPPTSSNRIRSLARPWWVGQDVRHAGQVAEHRLEAEPAPRAGVRLVAADHAGPLLAAHRRRAAVGQQVDDHVLGRDLEQVEVRPAAGSPRAPRAS